MPRRHSPRTRNQALKLLFALQEFSIANYASQAQLYVSDGEREHWAVILEIATHQTARAAEIGNLLANRRDFLQGSGFPMHLTGLNYLSVGHVARKMLTEQPKLIAAIHKCVDRLHGDREGKILAQRTLTSEEENLRHLKRVFGEVSDDAATLRMAA